MNFRKSTNNIPVESLFWAGIIIIIALLMSYGLLINRTVHNIVNREKISDRIAVLSSKTADSESKFLALSNAVTLESAYGRGFVNIKDIVYVKRVSNAVSLSFNNEE